MEPDTRRRMWIPLLVAAGLVVTGLWLIFGGDQGTEETITPADPAAVYNPVVAGEELPPGYRVGLARDQIAPVYEPEFTTANGVDWPDDSLVIGVAGDETARAYPVTHLNSREMVIDSLEGIPILVTW
jgi:hypothetical protein